MLPFRIYFIEYDISSRQIETRNNTVYVYETTKTRFHVNLSNRQVEALLVDTCDFMDTLNTRVDSMHQKPFK